MTIFAPAHVPPSPAEAFASIETELEALPEDAVLPVCVDLRYAAQVAMQAARRMEALLPEMVLLPEFDVGPVRRLAVYAAAALHAEMTLDRACTPVRPGAIDAWLAPRNDRARAYTVLVRAYDQCRRAVTFLRWCHGDAEQWVPPLHPVHAHLEVELEPSTRLAPPVVLPLERLGLADTKTAA